MIVWGCRQRPTPVFEAGTNVSCHGSGRMLCIVCQESIDNLQVLLRFASQTAKVATHFFIGPSHIAKRAKQYFQPTELSTQKAVAAGSGDQVVQAVIQGAGSCYECRIRSACSAH